MQGFIAEFVGTFLLVLLGDGVVTSCSLDKSLWKGGGSVHICWGWAFAVMIPAFIVGKTSGAFLNPAVSIAFMVEGSLAPATAISYIVAEMLGGFCGALLVWLMFKKHFDITENPAAILGCFANPAGIPAFWFNVLSEVVCTFVLVFGIKGISNVVDIASGLNYLFVWAIIAACGFCLGGATGYTMNPARDIPPRFAHMILPIPHKGTSNWTMGLVNLIGPIVGGIIAVLVFNAIPW